jgi:cellulose synthase/poly-beta-1,6-N-acetylglucosamine synthase-like glycosyltransferase
VHERYAPESPGKGQAIAWLLESLTEEADVCVFVDADSTVAPDFLVALNDSLGEDRDALQASYRVAEPESSPLVTLRALAFASMHEVRGRAKLRLGASCGIWGNGFAIRKTLLDEIGWASFSGVEDAEQHVRLVLSGSRVWFVPDARVYGYMPHTLASSTTQQRRWEAGRLALARRWSASLLGAAFRARSLSAGISLVELILPPMSVVLVLASMALIAAAAAGNLAQLTTAVGAFFLLAVYVARGLTLADLSLGAVFSSSVHAPRFVAWKLLLYVRELTRRREPEEWVRTAREKPARRS